MSKKSRGAKRTFQKEREKTKSRDKLHQFINSVPSVLKGMTLNEILIAYCNMFNCNNQFTYYKSLFTPEELKAIIIL